MSFIKKLRLSKRLPSVLSKSLNKQPTTNGALTNEQHNATTTGATLANNTTLNDSIVNSNNNTNNTTLNTTITTSASSKSGGDKRGKSDSRCLVIYHIDSETEGTWSLTVRNDDNGETVLNKVCDYYSLSGYKEYFGLKYTLVDEKGDHEIFWLDPFKLVGKQLKDTNNVLTFRVKHFPGKPQLIESEYVRYLIFLQIRNYLLKGDLQLSLTDEARLSAYAVQAYLGDYDPEVHHDHYLADLKFLPPQKSIKAEETIIELHKELRGKTPADMELAFLEKVSQFDTYGAELIVVKNSKGVEINFGVSHNGIITFLHGMPSSAAKICLYPWTQIGKISYDGRTLKVHAHTPDVKNPEIIKKQVMIFKCNSKRICKHLWKFILDQKAFFNFKRGIDVPKIKSSSSFFSHKSKFRFSGRCENELISSQYESSILNISPLSIATSPNDFNKTSTLPSFRGGSSVGTFKRRTFLNAHRSQAHSPQSINATASTNPTLISPIVEQQTTRGGNNDSNNNNLLLKRVENEENPETATIRDDQTQTSLSKPGSFAQLSINVSSPSGAASNELNLTSTPQPTSDKEMRSTTSGGRDLVREDEHTDSEDEDEDEFYDHDQVLSSSPSTPTVGVGEIDDLQRQFELYNGNGGKLISYRQQQANCGGDVMKNKQGRRPVICTVIILFGFFCLVLFIITLVQYAHCHVFSASTASCHYSRIVSRLNDNLSALNRRFLTPFKRSSTPYYTGSTSWPIYQYNSTNLLIDPLFSWFFSQYQPH